MLTDIERKVLRIVGNFSSCRKRLPSIHELEIKTGRDRRGILAVLGVLAAEGYIVWTESEPDKMVLLEAWERKPSIWTMPSFDPDRFMD